MHDRHDFRSLDRPCVRSAADAVRLFGEELRHLAHETLRIAHLDHGSYLIALTRQDGGHRALRFSLGRIVREAVQHQSRRLLLAHNHPGGDASPSIDDHIATRRIAELLRSIEVELVDHLIFAKDGIVSFRERGLL